MWRKISYIQGSFSSERFLPWEERQRDTVGDWVKVVAAQWLFDEEKKEKKGKFHVWWRINRGMDGDPHSAVHRHSRLGRGY